MMDLDLKILRERHPNRWREVAMEGIWHQWHRPLAAKNTAGNLSSVW